MSTILQGDSLEVLKTIDNDCIDTILTDPPYGYGFMQKSWDKAVPSVEIWQECLRVLKPGAFACVMSAPRSDVQQAMTERLIRAGFRLDFTPIYWTYASGFPKAGNIGKLVDKRLGNEREEVEGGRIAGTMGSNTMDGGKANAEYKHSKGSSELEGSYAGFQPKPAVEVVIVAMKPLSEKTYVDQALKNRKGITWLDDCRVPTEAPIETGRNGRSSKATFQASELVNEPQQYSTTGRFPANLLVSDDVLNDGVERKSNSIGRGSPNGTPKAQQVKYGGGQANVEYMDKGSYSRYFDLDAWARERLPAEQAMTFPFAIFPKASKSEKNKGLEHLADTIATKHSGAQTLGRATTLEKRQDEQGDTTIRLKNHHPTVKPLKLMAYLITLFSREGDTVLDPFVGSGTTAVAAEQLGRKGIGIEREAEYAEIARARVEHAKTEDDTNKQIQLID